MVLRHAGASAATLLCVLLLIAVAEAGAQQLRLVARNDLGGTGLNGSIAIAGTTAIVAAGLMPAGGVHAHLYNPYACQAVDVKLLDLSNPAKPIVKGRIPVPAGLMANDVSVRRVRTAAFSGDLAAIALSSCGGTGSTHERGIAYYDISNPAHPFYLGRYAADGDSIRPASVLPWADGRVLSLSTEPGASASNLPSGDLRIVDVSNPRSPVQIGSFPGRKEPIFSANGCRPFRAAHDARVSPDGRGVLLAFYDAGLISVDLTDAASPKRTGALDFGKARNVEGNAGYIASGFIGRRPVALLSEQDWLAPETTLHIETSDSARAPMHACEAVFTLFDPQNRAQIYRQPGARLSGEMVYVGRGCPGAVADNSGHDMDGMHAVATDVDAYLSDVKGQTRADRSIEAGNAAEHQQGRSLFGSEPCETGAGGRSPRRHPRPDVGHVSGSILSGR